MFSVIWYSKEVNCVNETLLTRVTINFQISLESRTLGSISENV
jgi:hypothetical protein